MFFTDLLRAAGGGFSIIGHHEIMFPLLAAAVIEGLNEDI